jgi:hypothetical protein
MTTQSLAVRLLAAALVLVTGCARETGRERGTRGADSTLNLPVRVFSDTPGQRLAVEPPALSVWVSRVSPSRPADPAALAPPEPPSGVPESEAPPPALEIDPDLKPPILRTPASLHLPSRPSPGLHSVELDVRVAEDGTVSDALWAGGNADSALVRSAIESALGMRFYPALQAGRPVAVWCRQRFDFQR